MLELRRRRPNHCHELRSRPSNCPTRVVKPASPSPSPSLLLPLAHGNTTDRVTIADGSVYGAAEKTTVEISCMCVRAPVECERFVRVRL